MNAGVRAAGAVQAKIEAKNVLERLLNELLDGDAGFLDLPAGVVRAVVSDSELHANSRGLRLCRHKGGGGHAASRSQLCSSQDFDFFFETWPEPVLLNLQIVMRLQVQPELRRHLKIPAETQRSVRSDSSLAFDDLVDPTRRNSDVFGKTILRDAHRFEKFLFQNLTRRDVRQRFALHILMIIHNFN